MKQSSPFSFRSVRQSLPDIGRWEAAWQTEQYV